MKLTYLRSALFAFLLPLCTTTQAQVVNRIQQVNRPVDCVMPATFSREKISLPYTFKKKSDQRLLNFTINYLAAGAMLNGNTCSTWPAVAQTAFTYAMSIWSDVLENEQNIGVDACWTESLAMNTLGSAGPTTFLGLSFGSEVPATFYPVALAEHFLNSQDTTVDINASFNANRTDWYFGTDANPGFSEFDFVTVVLHELGHGLGFLGGSGIDDGVNNGTDNLDECEGVAGTGCIGLLAGDGNFYPTIYDRFIDIDDDTPIIGMTNPSVDVATVLEGGSTTSGSGGLEIDEDNLDFFRAHGIKIYSPATYNGGSSYSHFDEDTPALANELMSPFVANGQAIHVVGLAQTVMEEIGWSPVVVPVKLISFDVVLENQEVLLNWNTSLEINNDFFSIEKSFDNIAFQQIGQVNGNGNSTIQNEYTFTDRNPASGANYYRLKQIDFDGASEYSEVKVVEYRDDNHDLTILQNPAYDVLTIKLGIYQNSNSTISIFESSGRMVKSLNIDVLNAVLNIDISDLSQGNYYIRMTNGVSVASKKFIKIDK